MVTHAQDPSFLQVEKYDAKASMARGNEQDAKSTAMAVLFRICELMACCRCIDFRSTAGVRLLGYSSLSYVLNAGGVLYLAREDVLLVPI